MQQKLFINSTSRRDEKWLIDCQDLCRFSLHKKKAWKLNQAAIKIRSRVDNSIRWGRRRAGRGRGAV